MSNIKKKQSLWDLTSCLGPEKFAEIFLGEFETPEAIWNSEMRRMMIEKIAAHIADFSPRLQSNVRALYQVNQWRKTYTYLDSTLVDT